MAVTPDQVPMWTHKAGHALAWSEGSGERTLWSMTLCGTLSVGSYLAVPTRPKRICKKCRDVMRDPRLELKVK
mgnify:CR=1 FL=1